MLLSCMGSESKIEIVYFHTVALLIIKLLYILVGELMLQSVLGLILSITLLRTYLGHSVPIKSISHDEPGVIKKPVFQFPEMRINSRTAK